MTDRVKKDRVKRSKSGLMLDVEALGSEYGYVRFWSDVIAKRLLPTIRPPGYRRVFVKRCDVEALLASWTEEASAE